MDGVPVIDKSKLDKLLQKISKDFSRKGCPIKPENINVPWDDAKGKSKGCVCSCSGIKPQHAYDLYIVGIFSWSLRTPMMLLAHSRR